MIRVLLLNFFLYLFVSYSELTLFEYFAKKQKNLLRRLLFAIGMSTIIAIYNTYWTLNENITINQYLVLMTSFALLMTNVFYAFFIREFSLKVVTLTFFVTFFSETLLDLANNLSENFLYIFPNINDVLLFALMLGVFSLLFGLLILLMKKISFEFLFEGIFSNKIYTWITLVCLLVLALQGLLSSLFGWTTLTDYPYIISGVSFLFIVILFAFFSFRESVRHRLKTQEAMYLQQENYIQSLEQIQQEMRSLQHDYKNVISGIYLQSEKGNFDEIKLYLESSILNIDNNVTDKLKHTSNLRNIKVIELKSLLLIKLSEMTKKSIDFNLEVIHPIKNIDMSTEDIIRCLGILIDNAIEAVEEITEETKVIDLVLLDEKNGLTIMIKNPIQDQIEFNKIENRGYSTKGDNRGIGLYNYNEIINRYPHAMKQTIVEVDSFKQVLMLTK